MRGFARFCLATMFALSACACARHTESTAASEGYRPPVLLSATLQDLMDAEIDPAADYIWAAVGTVVTRAGTEERRPHGDEEWRELRRRAIVLVEATNLLMMPGRAVSAAPIPSEGPGVLDSAEIAANLRRDPAAFAGFAVNLRTAGLAVLAAIEAKDADALSKAGETLDAACESCHVANWYPHQVIPKLPDF